MALPVRLVLMRPRNAQNLGAAARAMKNFGLTDWCWVEPYATGDQEARKLAVHAEELLEQRRTCATLEEAVRDCVWVTGTSSRRVDGKKSWEPRAWALEALERGSPQSPVALVFGDERHGLRTQELLACHALSTVPTDDRQPSLNLAQAVLLYAYELWTAQRTRAPESKGSPAVAATDAELRALESAIRAALKASGFLQPNERHAMRDLVAPWVRSRLTRKEAGLWMAAVKGIIKAMAAAAL